MTTLAFASALATTVPLTPREALSGVFGAISLAAWVFLLVPQLIENYQQQSASGVSLLFLFVWFLGDITNLLGAVWARLVPTVIAIAIYFCFADTVLIAQCLYYNVLNARRDKKRETTKKNFAGTLSGELNNTGDADRGTLGEDAPLLSRQRSESNAALPGSQRRSSMSSRYQRSTISRRDSLERILEEGRGKSAWIKNTLSIFLVCLAGTVGWVIAWRANVWKPQPVQGEGQGDTPLGAEILGYASAVLYLGARIPQIIKNQREKSCEGLSLLFFLLSLLGNSTYGAGILCHSTERDYVLTNLPWLIGSLGTMAEDVIIFVQFRVFEDNRVSEVAVH